MTRKYLYILLALDLILVLAHIFWGQSVYILNLDYERTVPAYYSGLKLVSISALALAVFFLLKKKKEKIIWLLVSFFFIGLAFDEISELHENLGDYFLSVFQNYSIFEQASFMWLIFLSPFILGALAVLIYFLFSLRGHKSFYYVLIGLICFILVLAFEFLGGLIIRSHYDIYQLVIVTEEAMEKIGASFFFFGILLFFRDRFNRLYRKI
jgi:hypothetical protein